MNIQTSQMAPTAAAHKFHHRGITDKAKVTHDSQKDSFVFTEPGSSITLNRHNALLEGAKVGVAMAVPAFIGAAQNAAVGTLAAGLGGTYTGVLGGLLIGGAWGGYSAYKGSNKNPMYAALGGAGGALAGAILFPLLKQPGLWGGVTGAAVATGVGFLGAAIFQANQNRKITEDAKALGWKP